jgi:hypothetical protein
MGRFEMVDSQMYGDPAYRELSTDARLLFIWSWTNPQSTICGLYGCSVRQMQLALGDTRLGMEPMSDRVLAALEQLARKPLVEYDEDNEVLWVINRVRYANRSPKVARAMQKEVEKCPPSPLIERFVAQYGRTLGIAIREESHVNGRMR